LSSRNQNHENSQKDIPFLTADIGRAKIKSDCPELEIISEDEDFTAQISCKDERKSDCQLRWVSLSSENKPAVSGRILMKFDFEEFSENLSIKFNFNLN
jgi:hypothetical protein